MNRLAFVAALASLGLPLAARAAGQSWTLDNGVIRKTVTFSPQYGLEVEKWSDLTSGFDFIAATVTHHGYNEFQFTSDGKSVSGKSADVSLIGSHEDRSADGTEHLDLTLVAKRALITVGVHYELAKDAPAIRQYLTVINRGKVPIVLRHMTVSAATLAPGPEHDLVAYGGYGEQPRETYFTGRVNDVAVLLENAKTGNGFAVLSEVPGYLKRTEIGQIGWTQWSPAFAAMYDTDLFPFERTLTPKETFTSAAVSVLFYQRGTAGDPHWRIPAYVRDHIARSHSAAPDWIYNTWEPFHKEINAALLNDLLPKVAAEGFTLITLDDGWEARYGDNDVDTSHFPGGLDPIFARADEFHLKHGLWAPLALVDTKSRDLMAHPDWACREQDGDLRISNGGSGVVMSLASPYKFGAIERISELVTRYQLSYIKLDLTTIFNTYGEQPGCFEIRDEYKTPQESSERIYEALDLIARTLHQRFPELRIDYTFELWGEKHLIDYGLLRVADLDWLSNVGDQSPEAAGPLQARTLMYQRALAIPTETMLIGNLQAETPSWQERVATSMGFGPVLLGDLRKQSIEDSAGARDWITRYTRLRNSVSITDSFFPLGSWQQPRSDQWDGFARLAQSGEGLIVLFRNDSVKASPEISIPGFPDGLFTLKSWSSATEIEVQGSALRHTVSIPFSDVQAVSVWEVQRRDAR
jgi:alpha-galactosidase